MCRRSSDVLRSATPGQQISPCGHVTMYPLLEARLLLADLRLQNASTATDLSPESRDHVPPPRVRWAAAEVRRAAGGRTSAVSSADLYRGIAPWCGVGLCGRDARPRADRPPLPGAHCSRQRPPDRGGLGRARQCIARAPT